MDYRSQTSFERSVKVTKELFGDDVEIYVIGFSLGANYVMRYLGSNNESQNLRNIKAAVSVSGAFDLPSTVCDIQNAYWGLINGFILHRFQTQFAESRFKL